MPHPASLPLPEAFEMRKRNLNLEATRAIFRRMSIMYRLVYHQSIKLKPIRISNPDQTHHTRKEPNQSEIRVILMESDNHPEN
jgi:hypothetical protein